MVVNNVGAEIMSDKKSERLEAHLACTQQHTLQSFPPWAVCLMVATGQSLVIASRSSSFVSESNHFKNYVSSHLHLLTPTIPSPISANRNNRDRFWRLAKIGNPDFPDFCDRRNRIPIIAIFASSQKLGILIFPILASRKNRDSYFCEWLSAIEWNLADQEISQIRISRFFAKYPGKFIFVSNIVVTVVT